MSLDEELAAFNALRASLLIAHEGETALFKEGQVVSFHLNAQEAYYAGQTKYGLDVEFLIEDVTRSFDATRSFVFG